MAVAKSYEKMEIQSEPFKENGRMYVYVLAPKGPKKVRWYNIAPNTTASAIKFNAHDAFGFGTENYITLFKGDALTIEHWAYETDPCRARYNTLFKWFCPSWLPIVNLPSSIEMVRLNWSDVGKNEFEMKSDEEVVKYIQNCMGVQLSSTSQYQGQKDEWLERTVIVIEDSAVRGPYGISHTYIMEDTNGNVYSWTTSSKELPIDAPIIMRMKVKDHKEVKGTLQTIVYYCKEKK